MVDLPILALTLAGLSALFFSLQGVMNRKAVMGRDIIAGSYLSVVVTVPLLLPAVILDGNISSIFSTTPKSLLFLAMVGLSHYMIGRTLNAASVKAIGITRSIPLRETAILHSAAYGLLFLNESLSIAAGFAIGLMAFGVVITAMSGGAISNDRGFNRTVLLKGIFFGLLGASFWGMSPVFAKAALPGVASPILATWIAFIFAALGYTGFQGIRGKIGNVRGLGRSGIFFFAMTGLFAAGAQMTRFLALDMANFFTVIPFQMGINPVITLVISFILIRRIESIDRWVVSGVGVATLGAVIIASGV